jgi:hypothetical protein
MSTSLVFFVRALKFSPGHQEGAEKTKATKESGGGRGLRGLVFPATSSPLFQTQGTLKVGFLSNLQVAGWLFGNHRS